MILHSSLNYLYCLIKYLTFVAYLTSNLKLHSLKERWQKLKLQLMVLVE